LKDAAGRGLSQFTPGSRMTIRTRPPRLLGGTAWKSPWLVPVVEAYGGRLAIEATMGCTSVGDTYGCAIDWAIRRRVGGGKRSPAIG